MRAWWQALLFWQAASGEERQERLGESALQALSPTTIARLRRELADLPEPQSRLQAARAAASEALHAWYADADAPNYFTITTAPIEPQPKLLQEFLSAPPFGGTTQITQLQREQFADTDTRIWPVLQETFGLLGEVPNGERAIAAIPDLSWCFLRSMEGLDAIEALLAAIATDRSRFWLLGCNNWAWLYLERVCHLKAYLKSPVSLQLLSGRDLRQWLDPVVTAFSLKLPQARDDSEAVENDEEIWASALEQRCFAQIAKQAAGLPAVAAPLWLRSLRQRVADEGEEEDATVKELTYEVPNLPDLPQLTSDDRYLLYILGLHGGLTFPALIRSLAEPEAMVQAQLQSLQRQGLICKRANRVAIAPLYYPRLQRDLANNHLLVEGEI